MNLSSLLLSSADFKMHGSFISLFKHKDNFAFLFTYRLYMFQAPASTKRY
jgi:hypothetical protein